jgi:hypothetical protein
MHQTSWLLPVTTCPTSTCDVRGLLSTPPSLPPYTSLHLHTQVDVDQCISRARQGYARHQYRPMQGAALVAAGGSSNGPTTAGSGAGRAGGGQGAAEGRLGSEPPGAAGAASPSTMDVDEPDRPADSAAAAAAAAAGAGNGGGSAGEEAGAKPEGAEGAGGAEAGAAGEGGASHLTNKGLKRHRHEEEGLEEQAGPKDAHGPHALVSWGNAVERGRSSSLPLRYEQAA